MDDECITISDDEDVLILKHIVNLDKEPIVIDLTSNDEATQRAQPSPEPSDQKTQPPPSYQRPSQSSDEAESSSSSSCSSSSSQTEPSPPSEPSQAQNKFQSTQTSEPYRPFPKPHQQKQTNQPWESPQPKQPSRKSYPQQSSPPSQTSQPNLSPKATQSHQQPTQAPRPTTHSPQSVPRTQSSHQDQPVQPASPVQPLQSSQANQPTPSPQQQASRARTMSDHELLLAQKKLGNDKYRNNQFEDAIRIYKRAISLAKALESKEMSAILHFNLAMTYDKLKYYEQAADECAMAVKFNANYMKAHQKRAEIFLQQGKFEEAVICFEYLCELDNANPYYAQRLRLASERAKQSRKKSYHEILGLNSNFTREDLKRAYRRLALNHHPDRHSDADIVTRRINEKRFKDATEANSYLQTRHGYFL